jgi:hypothetical protein
MLDYHFNLSTIQPASNPGLSILQEKLVSAGILMDLTFRDGSLGLHIRIMDRTPETEKPQETMQKSSEIGNSANPEIPCTVFQPPAEHESEKPHMGRRPIAPKHDLTLAQVKELQNRGTGLDGIAHLIGVSRRTFFRKWAAVHRLNPDPETPFSKWAGR